jgi:hypothetical protein
MMLRKPLVWVKTLELLVKTTSAAQTLIKAFTLRREKE